MKLSVVIPVYNEEEVLPQLLTRLSAVLDGIEGGPHEVIFVDDGSADRSFEVLTEAAATDPRLVLVKLSRNFGHQAALAAGIEQVSGDACVFMDADLQDCPEEIPRFLQKHAEGFDVVYARRTKRKEPLWLRTAYATYYRLLKVVSDVEQPLDAGDFSLMGKPVVDQIRELREHNPYLRGLRTWVGFRQTGIDVERAARAAGESSYSLGRLVRLGFDGLFSFSALPIRLATIMGSVALVVTGIYVLYAVLAKVLWGQSPAGFTGIIVAGFFMSGAQLLFLGLVGEYIHRILEEVRKRPVYIVSDRIRSEPGSDGEARSSGLESAAEAAPGTRAQA